MAADAHLDVLVHFGKGINVLELGLVPENTIYIAISHTSQNLKFLALSWIASPGAELGFTILISGNRHI